jgi:hypothetical protein
MADHAWCRDPSRDERVRAAEDGRDRPLPTLEEAIARAFGFDKASAQRACDEVKSWPEDVQKDCRFVLGNLLEQGVDRLQALVEAWRYGKGLLAARYPEMIPKSVSASSAVEHENKGNGMRTERVTLEVTYRWLNPPSKWNWNHVITSPMVTLKEGESVRVVQEAHFDDLAQVAMEREAAIRERESWKLLADRTNERLSASEARVAELEAASGGGEGEVDAWGIVRDGNVESVTHRRFRGEAECCAARLVGTVVPLYRAPPQPRGWLTGEEREAVETARDHFDDDDHGDSECVFIARMLKQILARSTPPKVRLPECPYDHYDDGWAPWFAAVGAMRKALAAAGVEVADA